MSEIKFKLYDNSFYEKIAGRKAIFLDTSAWINLADERGSEARPVKSLLEGLVDDQKVFCPLSFSVIAELFKQNYASALRVSNLMEKFSLNISFIVDDEIYKKEIDDFISSFIEGKVTGLLKADVFVPVIGYLSSQMSLIFPEGFPGTEEQIKHFSEQVTERLRYLTISDLVIAFKDFLPLPETIRPPRYSEVRKEIWQLTKGDRRKMRRIEEERVGIEILIPRLLEQVAKLPIPLKQKFFGYLQSLPKDAYDGAAGTILNNMPALKSTIDVLTMALYDPNRKDKLNDFYDIQMMISPLAYADIFVAQDKWIKDLLVNRSSVLKMRGVKFFSNLSDFHLHLKALDNPVGV